MNKIMGNTSSKENNAEYNLYKEPRINVIFCQLAKLPGCNVTPIQLNALLGLNIPRYGVFEGTPFPYVFCVSSITDITTIAKEYGYEVGSITKERVFKYEFNSSYIVSFSLSRISSCKLEPIR